MRLTFIHEAEKLKFDDEGNIYTDGSYNTETWNSYYQLFDEITVLMRKDDNVYSKSEALKKFNPCPTDRFSFIEIPDISKTISNFVNLIDRKNKRKLLAQHIESSENIILRLPGLNGIVSVLNKKKKKYIIEVVGCVFDGYWNHGMYGKVLAPFLFLRMRSDLKKAKNAVFVTDEFLQRRYPTTAKAISCSNVKIDSSRISQKIYSTFATNQYIYLGTAAGLGVKYKGQQYVIRALSKLKKMGIENIRYRIAGHGDQSYLKNIAKKYGVLDFIEFSGSIPRSEMSVWLRSIDIYIQPSKQEGLPRALIEAMAHGLYCIGSDAGGIPELLSEDCIFPAGSVNQLSQILLRIIGTDLQDIMIKSKVNSNISKKYSLENLDSKRLFFMKEVFGDEENFD